MNDLAPLKTPSAVIESSQIGLTSKGENSQESYNRIQGITFTEKVKILQRRLDSPSEIQSSESDSSGHPKTKIHTLEFISQIFEAINTDDFIKINQLVKNLDPPMVLQGFRFLKKE